MPQPRFIDSAEPLRQLCEQLAGVEWIAVDTEFLRERSYRPELCLIQLATAEVVACIDPLAVALDPLLDLLYDERITKVFHAASQDLEIFHCLRGRPPQPVFDTQLAAPLLGHDEQMGYARLVQAVLGVELAKAHSRTDWSQRPLSAAQLSYAADDVVYLAQLYPRMRGELQRLGRLDWLTAEFDALLDPARYDKPLEDLWQKLRGVERLRGHSLAIAQELAAWRERSAREANLPRNWVMKDDVLLDIAKLKPSDAGELARIRGLSDGARKRHAAALLQLVRECRDQQPRALPRRRKNKPSAAQEAVLTLLEAVARQRAAELDINPAQLAPRRELERLMQSNNGSLVEAGWRQQLIGAQLRRVLDGECRLSVANGMLKIEQNAK